MYFVIDNSDFYYYYYYYYYLLIAINHCLLGHKEN